MDKLTQRKREKRHKRFVDLRASEEEVMGQFSKTVRRRIRNNRDGDYAVETGGEAALRWVVNRVNERFTEQGESTPLTAKFGPEVQSYHNVRRTSRSIDTVAGIYRRIQNGGGLLG